MPLLTEMNAAPLTKEDITKLNESGVVTVIDLLKSELGLFQAAGVSYENIAAVKARFLHQYSSPVEKLNDYQYSGLRIYDASKTFNDLNKILGGGFHSQEITELCGKAASGKTHLCHQLAIDFALKYHKVLYIDTDASFSGRKIRRLFNNRHMLKSNFDHVMSKIRVRSLSSYHQVMSFISSLKKAMENEVPHINPDVIIIDSIVTPLAPKFLNASSFGEKSKLLSIFIQELNSLFSIKKTLAIIAVNSEANWFGLQWKNACAVSLCLDYVDGHTVVSLDKSNRETNINEESKVTIL